MAILKSMQNLMFIENRSALHGPRVLRFLLKGILGEAAPSHSNLPSTACKVISLKTIFISLVYTSTLKFLKRVESCNLCY